MCMRVRARVLQYCLDFHIEANISDILIELFLTLPGVQRPSPVLGTQFAASGTSSASGGPQPGLNCGARASRGSWPLEQG